MDSQVFETIWALISAFLSDFGYHANQTLKLLLAAHNTYNYFKSNEHASTTILESGFISWTLGVIQKDYMHVWAVQCMMKRQRLDHLECDVLSYDSKT